MFSLVSLVLRLFLGRRHPALIGFRVLVAAGVFVYGMVLVAQIPSTRSAGDRYTAAHACIPDAAGDAPVPAPDGCYSVVPATLLNVTTSGTTYHMLLQVPQEGSVDATMAGTIDPTQFTVGKPVAVKVWGSDVTGVGVIPDNAGSVNGPVYLRFSQTTLNPTVTAGHVSALGPVLAGAGALGLLLSGLPLVLGLLASRRRAPAGAPGGWMPPPMPVPAGAGLAPYGAPPVGPPPDPATRDLYAAAGIAMYAPPQAAPPTPAGPADTAPIAPAAVEPTDTAPVTPPAPPDTAGAAPVAEAATWGVRTPAPRSQPQYTVASAAPPAPAPDAGEAATIPAPADATPSQAPERGRSRPRPPAASPEPADVAAGNPLLASQLRGLERMRLAELLSEAEYERRRAVLIAKAEASATQP